MSPDDDEDDDEFDNIDFRRLLGEMKDYPIEPPTFAPEGYAIELEKVVALLTNHFPDEDFEGSTVSEVVALVLAKVPQ